MTGRTDTDPSKRVSAISLLLSSKWKHYFKSFEFRIACNCTRPRFLLAELNHVESNAVVLIGKGIGGYLATMMMALMANEEEPIFRCGIVISPTTDWLRYGRKQAIVFPTLKLPFMWFILLRGQYSWKVLGRCSWSAILCSVKDRQTHSNDKKWYDIVDGFIPIQPGSTFSISKVQFPVDKCGHPVWLQSKLSF